MLKKVKKWKKHCKLAIFSSIFPSNGIFSMDYRWHWGSTSIFCLLQPKNWVFGSKRVKFGILKKFDLAPFWGSGALIMLPQGLEDVCEQRGPPDDNFEYWTASVPRRGAEIRAAKVFWRKPKIPKNAILLSFESIHPDVFIFTKMVLRGTNWSHMKTFITTLWVIKAY